MLVLIETLSRETQQVEKEELKGQQIFIKMKNYDWISFLYPGATLYGNTVVSWIVSII